MLIHVVYTSTGTSHYTAAVVRRSYSQDYGRLRTPHYIRQYDTTTPSRPPAELEARLPLVSLPPDHRSDAASPPRSSWSSTRSPANCQIWTWMASSPLLHDRPCNSLYPLRLRPWVRFLFISPLDIGNLRAFSPRRRLARLDPYVRRTAATDDILAYAANTTRAARRDWCMVCGAATHDALATGTPLAADFGGRLMTM